MLNPSTADEISNDATVERCERRARGLGYGGLFVVNLFAFRSTDPFALYREQDPVGPQNLAAISAAARDSAFVVCAWGKHGAHLGMGERVLNRLHRHYQEKIRVLKVNADGMPGHPLYLPYSLKPKPMPADAMRRLGR